MQIVVINRNQQSFVEPMCKALAPMHPIFVFDRCEPVTDVTHKVNHDGVGFLAGKMRDIGAEGIDDDILFLDGDKIPQGDIVADIERLKCKYDAICYGIAGENENSELRSFMRSEDIDDIVPWQKEKLPFASGCYSCGLWLSRDIIRKVRELNGGRIFHPDFDGIWGDEDNFLADEINDLGGKIGYSTHVRLSGNFSDFSNKAEEYFINAYKRIELRKSLLGREV